MFYAAIRAISGYAQRAALRRYVIWRRSAITRLSRHVRMARRHAGVTRRRARRERVRAFRFSFALLIFFAASMLSVRRADMLPL